MNPTPAASWIAGTAARLGLPRGESYLRGYAFLPWWVGLTAAFVLLAAGIQATVRRRAARPPRGSGQAAGGWREALTLGLFAALVVAAGDGPGFIHGFFRQDDFSFLQVARTVPGLGHQMRLYHSDHVYPLYRLEVWMLVRLAGDNASATGLAAWFNAANFVTCVGLLWSGCWALSEMGGSRLATFALAFLLWTWPGWGEFTAGYYTLSAYVQVQGLAFAATAAMLRGFRRDSPGWLGASLILLAAALATDLSGVTAFASVLLVGGAWRGREPLRGRMPYFLGLGAIFLLALVSYLLVFRHAYSARELVQNPSGQPAGPGMLIGLRHRPLGVLVGAIQAAGGLGLNLVLPTFLQFDIDRVVASPLLRDGLISLELLVLAGGGWFAGGRLCRLAAEDRRLILAVAACAAAGLSIVVVARTDYALEVPAALWPSKYVVMPACWLWLGIALFWDRWRARSGSLDPPPYLLAVVAAGIWMTGSYALWERVLLPESLAYAPRGRWGNEQNAEDRARHYGIVMADLSAIARETGSARVWLPRWSDWDAEFFRLHGVLEWGGDQRPHGVTYLFWDLLAASPGLHLRGEWAPRDALPSRVREYLTRYAWLQPSGSASPPAEPAGVDSRRRF